MKIISPWTYIITPYGGTEGKYQGSSQKVVWLNQVEDTYRQGIHTHTHTHTQIRVETRNIQKGVRSDLSSV